MEMETDKICGSMHSLKEEAPNSGIAYKTSFFGLQYKEKHGNFSQNCAILGQWSSFSHL